jgi:DNA-binding beta-propeller fold protein YncE
VRPGFLILLLVLVAGQNGRNAEPLVQTGAIDLPDVRGRIDHLAVDTGSQRAFVAALGNNTVEVLDLRAGAHVRSLTGFKEPQGIAVAAGTRAVAVANGAGEGLQLLSADDYRTTRTIFLGNDADNVRYDSGAGRVYVGYGDGALAAIDLSNGNVVAQARLGGHPESFQLEQGGPRIFVNVPSAGHIAVVDRTAMKITTTWPVTTARANYPMALDGRGHRLFVGCRRPAQVLVYDSASGKELGGFDIVGDTDDLFFDAERQRLYVSGGEGFIDVFDTRPDRHFARIARVPTAAGARTSLFVPELNRLLLAVPHRDGRTAQVRIYEPR